MCRSKSSAPTIAYSDAFGEGGLNDTVSYYMASSFRKIYMMPSGLLSTTGLATSSIFLRQLLDRRALATSSTLIEMLSLLAPLHWPLEDGFHDHLKTVSHFHDKALMPQHDLVTHCDQASKPEQCLGQCDCMEALHMKLRLAIDL